MSRQHTLGMRGIGAAAAVLCAVGLAGCTNTENGSSSTGASSSALPSVSLTSVTEDSALAARVPAALRAQGTLTIGAEMTYAPAEFLTSENVPVGYDVDLGKAIGKKLGLKVKEQPANFDGILPALGEKYNLGISGFTITDQRLQSVNMVSYLNGGSGLLVKKGNPQKLTLDDLCGKKIAVQTGTVQQDDLSDIFDKKCVAAGKAKVNAVPLSTNNESLTRLSTGAVSGVIADLVQIDYAAHQSSGQFQTISSSYGKSTYGIAVAKADPELAQLITDTTNSLIKDGTYSKIFTAWGAKDNMLTEAVLNPKQN